MFFLSQKTRKYSTLTVLAIVVSVSIFGFNIFRPTPVRAGMVDVNQGIRNVTDNIGDSLLAAGLGALVNGVSYFMRKVAYDTAKYVASGGKGQGALAFQEGFGEYLGTVAADSAFDALDELGKPFGLNICKPPDIRMQIGLQVSISNIFENELNRTVEGPTPNCTYNQFKENWDNARESVIGDRNLLENFNASLKTSQGDIGVALGILGKVDTLVAEKQLSAQLQRLEGEGFKAVSGLISDDIKTPAQIISTETKNQLTASAQTKLNTEQIAGIYGAGAVQILPMALSVFANTLVNSLLQNVVEKGLFPSKGDPSSVGDFYASNVNSNRQIAEQAFSYLIASVPQRPLTAYDVVTEFSTCGNNPGLNNCVMDSGLVQALERARVETPMTIAEALEQNLLHPNWPLIPEARTADNTNLQYCHSSAYCISNVEKLRKARILPLGFEIAVRKSSPDNPWTLGDVVDGFNACDPSGKPSPAYPYCKLIDPNWILKSPEARCEARVSGPELLTESAANRREECVDFSTCLQTDENGQCTGFGYCTKEENMWSMPGESCEPQFNTCKTYVSVESGQVGSYLSRTLDTQSCSADSIGCRSYSMEKVGNTWTPSASADPVLAFAGRTQAIHFTLSAQCPASAEGCSLFMDPLVNDSSSDDAKVFLKKAPEYLQCYDTDVTTPQTIEWPKTQAEIVKLEEQKSASCSQFASACTAEEVGCDEYRPKSGGASVAGIIGGNSCPTQCVGYETFKQEATAFESTKFPLHFIAGSGRTCSALQVGCDEFTNIDAANAGGESLEYYTSLKRCERPNGNNSGVFYSWEGSESQGYQLRRNTLLPITQSDAEYIAGLGLNYKTSDSVATVFPVGSPIYVEDVKTVMQSNYDQCNQESYNILLNNTQNDPRAADPDCRALYNANGEIFYRVFRNTVTVSNSCSPLRKTNSELVVDTNITAENGGASLCEAKGGVWGNSQCKRCASGGRYELNAEGIGSCVYQSIKAEATSCPVSANGCRSYIGNTGNNLYEVANFGFEPSDTSAGAINQAKLGWFGNTSIEAESLQVGLHSLRVNAQSTNYTFESGKLQPGAWYEIRFWARGNASFELSIGFSQDGAQIGNAFTFDPASNSNVPVSIGTQWQEYRVGPVQFTGDSTKQTQLYFNTQGSNQVFFLDNIEFVQIGGTASDHVFLIKNSWRTGEGYEVSLACDSTPNNGLPGEHLGCREYTRNDGQTFALTGFDRLCREEAVGCRALVDTQNTVSGVRPEEKQAYGVVCRKSTTVTNQTPCSVTLTESLGVSATYTCMVAKGERECRVQNPVVIPPAATHASITSGSFAGTSGRCISINGSCAVDNSDKLFIDESSVVVKEDSDLIYLAAQNQFLCQEENLACTRVGLETKNVNTDNANAYSYQDVFIKNDPRIYGDTLCTGNEVGCAAFKNDNSLVYFKDPKYSGNGQCVYKDKVTLGSGSSAQTYSGWFRDTGRCSVGNQECRTNSECGSNGQCIDIGIIPCDPTYLNAGNEYGIHSQGSQQYQGAVGVCESAYNGCTELVDRSAITPATPNGKSYYVLMNDRLTEGVAQCQGKVSQKEGCVLFDMTEDLDKVYNTSASYQASRSANPQDSLVTPVITGNLDANILLKVDRDRQCSEWLACGSSITVTDENGNKQVLCQQYVGCRKFGPTGECIERINATLDNSRMTEEKYISRDIGWNATEYSGYSFFNMYNPSNFVYLLFDGRKEAYMGYEMSHSFFTEDEARGCRETTNTSEGVTYVKSDGAVCGFDNGGRCYRERCIYPIEGTFTFTPAAGTSDAAVASNIQNMLKQLQPGICKSYPEQTSPFSIEIAVRDLNESDVKENGEFSRVDFTEKKELYERANVCQPGSASEDCSCEYVKVEYKNGVVDYWATSDAELVAPGICTGGDSDGNPCASTTECGVGGVCSTIKQRGTYVGQKGLCIEYDFSRPLGTSKATARLHEAFACLTWLPIQVSASAVDLNNLDPQAGYYPVQAYDSPLGGGHAYCTESTNRGAGYYDTSLNSLVNLGTFIGSNLTSIDQISTRPLYSGVEYREVFDIDNQTNYRVDRGTSVYRNLMSDTGTGPTEKMKVYRAIQAWSWKNIGPSARVLRLDTKGGDRVDYSEDLGGVGKEVYSFAPLVTEIVGSGGNLLEEDTGVLMHPPRKFSATQNSSGYSHIGEYYMNAGSEEIGKIGTMAFSPEIGLLPGFRDSNTFIHADGVVEAGLREDDLESVHFVPIAFTDGAEGVNPALLTAEVKIEFSVLKNAPANQRVYRNTVPAYSDGGADDQHTYNVTNSETNMTNISYVLNRTGDSESCGVNGLLSYCDYDSSGISPEGFIWELYNRPESEDMRDRNKIARRYVSVVFGSDSVEFSALQNAEVNTIDAFSDPFQVRCEQRGKNNWLAIGMDFNAEGEFLGYIARWCMATENSGGEATGIRIATIAKMQDRCLEYSAVVDNRVSLMEDNNKAWTDRVWAHSVYQPAANGLLSVIKGQTTGIAPYGSLPQSVVNAEILGANTQSLLTPIFGFPDYNFGVPYQCRGGDGFRTGANSIFASSRGCALPEDQPSVIATTIAANNEQGIQTLRNLFVKYYALKNFENISAGPRDLNLMGVIADLSGDLGLVGGTRPPQIFSINPYTCTQRGGNCTAAEADAFTLNLKNYTLADYNRDGAPDEDANRQDGVDPIVAEGAYHAVINFFAYADDNRMPIKKVTIKWDDGQLVHDSPVGLYKNRKPYCGTADNFSYNFDADSNSGLGRCVGTQITCNATEDCAYAGVNGAAVACALPTQASEGSVVTAGICRYHTVTYGNTCQVDTDCQALPGTTRSCELTGGFSGSSHQASGFCRYDTVASYTTNNSCQTISDCANISGSAVESCDLSQSTTGLGANVAVERHFGDAPRACKSEYFEFTHTYQCTGADTNATVGSIQTSDPEAYKRLIQRAGVSNETEICVFRPAVQVIDNWGWCNGTCDSGNGTLRNGCYGVKGSSWTKYSRLGGDEFSQCAPESDVYLGSDPWTYYGADLTGDGKGDGKIIILPVN